MNKDCIEKGISEYEFIELLLSINSIMKKNLEFDDFDLQKALYKYHEDGKFRFLFHNMIIDESEKIVDLKDAIDYSKSFGYVCKDSDLICDTQLLITIEEEESKRIIQKFNKDEIEAMFRLCSKLSLKKNKNYKKNIKIKK